MSDIMEYFLENSNSTICFQSYPAYYIKEIGRKNNTVRLNPTSAQISETMDLYRDGALKFIRIVNSINGKNFRRKLLDITLYENVMIFTWEPHEATK